MTTQKYDEIGSIKVEHSNADKVVTTVEEIKLQEVNE